MIDPHQVPLALYVHLPWCVRKCPYCDFNSHAVPASGLPEQAYLHALLEDLEFAAEEAQTRELVSVFLAAARRACFHRARSARCSRGRASCCLSRRTSRSRWKQIQERSSAAASPITQPRA
jgi:hypothetical protein